MTVRNRVLKILQKQQEIDTTSKEVAGVAKEQGLFICDKTVSFILRHYDNLEKRLFQIVSSVE